MVQDLLENCCLTLIPIFLEKTVEKTFSKLLPKEPIKLKRNSSVNSCFGLLCR